VLLTGTVADNVRYGPQLRGKKLTEAEVKSLLHLADLDPALCSKPASELSVGQAQRVALARTLANDPEATPLSLRLPCHALSSMASSLRRMESLHMHAGAPAGRADQRAGPHLDAEHRGGHRAAEEDEGAHHGDRLPQREADPAHRRPGVPRRRRRGRGGARAVRPVRRQAPDGQAFLGAQRLKARLLAAASLDFETLLPNRMLSSCSGWKGSDVWLSFQSPIMFSTFVLVYTYNLLK
jgi:hypothetical protein